MRLSDAQRAEFRRAGHLTVPGVFASAEMEHAIAEIERWGEAFLSHLKPAERAWYIDAGAKSTLLPHPLGDGGVKAKEALRKLDNPHRHCAAIAALARDARLVGLVESLIGAGVSVYFSQIFFKPPEGGGPKSVHQDNYYFGPQDPEALVTAWVALDDATVENGCLYFGEGTQLGPVYDHVAPPDKPFELHVPAEIAARVPMTAAPVPRGGVSFHHGTTFHQSGENRSTRWRRACALHYVRNDNRFVRPALAYDESVVTRIT